MKKLDRLLVLLLIANELVNLLAKGPKFVANNPSLSVVRLYLINHTTNYGFLLVLLFDELQIGVDVSGIEHFFILLLVELPYLQLLIYLFI